MTSSDSRIIGILALCLLLAGCGATGASDEAQPVGIGRGTDDFKRSPCACLEKKVAPPSADELDRLRRRLGAA